MDTEVKPRVKGPLLETIIAFSNRTVHLLTLRTRCRHDWRRPKEWPKNIWSRAQLTAALGPNSRGVCGREVDKRPNSRSSLKKKIAEVMTRLDRTVGNMHADSERFVESESRF